jgi:hypothetical protein
VRQADAHAFKPHRAAVSDDTTGPDKSAVNQSNLMTLVHPAVAEPDA